jgi:hypothetical protein
MCLEKSSLEQAVCCFLLAVGEQLCAAADSGQQRRHGLCSRAGWPAHSQSGTLLPVQRFVTLLARERMVSTMNEHVVGGVQCTNTCYCEWCDGFL